MSPRVSVVIPAYNSGAYITATIESVLAQTLTDFELIVCDHSSTDDTWERLQRFDGHPKVTLTRIEAGGGAVRNWNHVTALASGEYLKLVCGDDLIAPDCLARQVAELDRTPSAVVAACRRDLIDEQGKVFLRGRGLGGLYGVVSGTSAVRTIVRAGTNLLGEPMCVLFRREALERAGGWDGRFPYVIDNATYCNVLAHGDLVALPATLASFRVSAGQWSVALRDRQSDQVRAWHAELAATRPGVVSRHDVRRGNLRAVMLEAARKGVYLAFDRRAGR